MKKILLTIITLVAILSLAGCSITFGPGGSGSDDTNSDDDKEPIEQKYTITYNTNGGSTINSEQFIYDTVPTKPSNPTKNGYDFKGWYFDQTLNNEYEFSYSLKENITLYAKWNVVSYTIIYELNGGLNNKNNPSVYNIESDDIHLLDATKEGYDFEGWYLDSDYSEELTSIDTSLCKNITLYANYTQVSQRYTIKFNTNGGNLISNTSTDDDGKITPPANPTKEGYIFEGWYLESNLTTKINLATYTFTQNQTIFAKWTLEVKTYTVRFDTNGGNRINNIETNENGKITPPTNPTKEGYTFEGWYLDSNLTTKVDLNTYSFTKDITIYAKWLSTDATLYSITVNGEEFVIQSNIYDYEYEGINTNSFIITAKTSNEKATITGTGTYTVEYGNNKTYTITVTAENGVTQAYTMKIISKEVTSTETFESITSLNEQISATWADTGIANAKVEYKLSSEESYSQIDKELISYNNGIATANILGLTSGSYDIRVTSNNLNLLSKKNIEVTEIDRSGYAHYYTETNAIGAYNEDGSLKTNADVIYVSNATKNTVTYKVGSSTYTGLVNILTNASKFTKPVVIRVLDSIKTNQWKAKSDSPRLFDGSNYTTEAQKIAFATNELETTYGENLVGLTNKIMVIDYKTYTFTTTKTGFTSKSSTNTSKSSATYSRDEYPTITGKTVYDDDSYFNMIDISSSTKGLTIEGVGTNAEFFQFGLTFSNSKNIEVKNLAFTGYPEDACSFQGSSNSDAGNYTGFFIHNCTFNRGVNNWDVSGERDKYAGDGAIDLKRLSGVTLSYTKFNNCKKTGLVGGSNSDLTYNITFHHNYYLNVESRLPLGRQANMHIYNNYYVGCNQTIDLRSHAYVFMEGNYFDSSKLPRTQNDTDSAIKSFNDYYASNCLGITGSYTAPTIVTSRNKLVSNKCNVNGVDYSNFDTSSSLFYYDSTNQRSNVSHLTSAEVAKEECVKYAGTLKLNY